MVVSVDMLSGMMESAKNVDDSGSVREAWGLQPEIEKAAETRLPTLFTSIVPWVANKRFEVSKIKFKFPRARTYELIRARSRRYRSQILQVNTRWKALAEIYTMHSFAPFWNP